VASRFEPPGNEPAVPDIDPDLRATVRPQRATAEIERDAQVAARPASATRELALRGDRGAARRDAARPPQRTGGPPAREPGATTEATRPAGSPEPFAVALEGSPGAPSARVVERARVERIVGPSEERRAHTQGAEHDRIASVPGDEVTLDRAQAVPQDRRSSGSPAMPEVVRRDLEITDTEWHASPSDPAIPAYCDPTTPAHRADEAREVATPRPSPQRLAGRGALARERTQDVAAHGPAWEAPAPSVRVEIGRMEVRVAAPPAPARPRRTPAPPVLSLREYLARQNGDRS
jgi:hypothetical protein